MCHFIDINSWFVVSTCLLTVAAHAVQPEACAEPDLSPDWLTSTVPSLPDLSAFVYSKLPQLSLHRIKKSMQQLLVIQTTVAVSLEL